MRLGCSQAKPSLLRLLLGDEQLHIACRTQLVLPLNRAERLLRGFIGGSECRQGLRVVFHRAQDVSDIAQGLQHDALIVGGGSVEGGECGALLRRQTRIE